MRLQACLLAAALLLCTAATSACAADPDALWKIVHGRCVPDEQAQHDPAPCAVVDLADGYALLKDIVGDTQFLLIPTARVTGIEDKAILAPDAPNYFAEAWAQRGAVSQRAGHALPDDDMSLAINSVYGRTQNQLHIHIDCISPAVKAALAQHVAEIGTGWAPFPVALGGHRYRAIRLPYTSLADNNPFRLLAATVPQDQMGRHTLVLAAVSRGGQTAFVLLDDTADLTAGDRGSGETLQDHSCALAH